MDERGAGRMTTPTLRGTAQPFGDASGRKYRRGTRDCSQTGTACGSSRASTASTGRTALARRPTEETRKAYAKNPTLDRRGRRLRAERTERGRGDVLRRLATPTTSRTARPRAMSDTKSKWGAGRERICRTSGTSATHRPSAVRPRGSRPRRRSTGRSRCPSRARARRGGAWLPKTGANVWGELTVSFARWQLAPRTAQLRVLRRRPRRPACSRRTRPGARSSGATRTRARRCSSSRARRSCSPGARLTSWPRSRTHAPARPGGACWSGPTSASTTSGSASRRLGTTTPARQARQDEREPRDPDPSEPPSRSCAS